MKHINRSFDQFIIDTSIGTLNVLARTKDGQLNSISWLFIFHDPYKPQGEDKVVCHATRNTTIPVYEVGHLIQHFKDTIKMYHRINNDGELTFKEDDDLDILGLKLMEIRDRALVDYRC